MALNINTLADNLSKSSSTAASAAQSSSSLIATSSKDTLVAVDGYGKTTTSTLTSMKNGVLDSINATKNYLLNTKITDLGSLSDLLSQAASVKDSATNSIAQISSFIGQSTNTVKGISDEVINGATATLNTLNQTTNNIFSTVDGTVTELSSTTNILSANNFLTSINTLLATSDMTFKNLTDKLSESALKASILGYASQLGMANVIDSVYKSDPSNAVLTAALGDNLQSAFYAGNLQLINTLVSNLGSTYVLTKLPNAVQLLLQNFTFDSTIKAEQYPTQATSLVQTLVSINPNWDKSESAYWGSTLSVYSGISSKASTVLKTLQSYNRKIAIATHFDSTSQLSKAKAMYPYLAV